MNKVEHLLTIEMLRTELVFSPKNCAHFKEAKNRTKLIQIKFLRMNKHLCSNGAALSYLH